MAAASGSFLGARGVLPESLEVDDLAGERACDAVERLDAGNDKLAQGVDVVRLGDDDDVVRTGDRVRRGDPVDVRDRLGDLRRLADLGLDQDVRRDSHEGPPRVVSFRAAAPPRSGRMLQRPSSRANTLNASKSTRQGGGRRPHPGPKPGPTPAPPRASTRPQPGQGWLAKQLGTLPAFPSGT